MNKDKCIRNLKERNRSLKHQLELKDVRISVLEVNAKEKDKEIIRLNVIIDKLWSQIGEQVAKIVELEKSKKDGDKE